MVTLQDQCESDKAVVDLAEIGDAFVGDVRVGVNQLPFAPYKRMALDWTSLDELDRLTIVSTTAYDDRAMLLIERKVGRANFADRSPEVLKHESNIA